MSKLRKLLRAIGRTLRSNMGKIGITIALGGGYFAVIEHDLPSSGTAVSIQKGSEAAVNVDSAN